jgi:hypothetical protein
MQSATASFSLPILPRAHQARGLVTFAIIIVAISSVAPAHGSGPESPEAPDIATKEQVSPLLPVGSSWWLLGAVGSSPPLMLELARIDATPLTTNSGLARLDLDHPRLREPPGWRAASWRAPNRLWTAIEIAGTVAAGGTNYWIQRGGYPRWGLSSWPGRLSTDIYILDTNDFRTNFSFHTIAGAAWHLAPRANDLSLLESMAWGVGASLFWEYVIEFRDKVDVNDMVFTTPAGMAVGEFAHHFGRLLHQGREGRGWDVARWTLGFPQTFNDAVRGANGPRGPRIEHDLHAGAGVAYARGHELRQGDRASGHGGISFVRAGGSLSALEGAYAAGTRWRGFREANFTSLEAVLAAGSGGRRSIHVVSDAVLAGWRYTHIADDRSRGSALNLGTSTGLRYHQQRYGPWRDRLGMAHLPGLALDLEHWNPHLRARGLARLHFDYGGLHAHGYPDWQAADPDAVGLSAIAKEGYFHAWGGSVRLGGELEVSRLRAGGATFLGTYRPHRNLDEFRAGREHHEFSDRPAVTDGQRITSRVSDLELWLGTRLPRESYIQARTVVRSRLEHFEEFTTRARALETGIEIGKTF